MTVQIPYGDDSIEVSLPDQNYAGMIELVRGDRIKDVVETVHESILERGFERFIGGAKRVLLVVNDRFRTTPSHLAIAALKDHLANFDDLRLIVATGLHRPCSEEEVRGLVGEDFVDSGIAIVSSDARDIDQFESVGSRADGSEVLFHKLIGWAEKIIVIGSVEPHYFAGFTGGPKSFLPGLSHESTIGANHILAIDTNSQPGVIEGNPVAESIREAAGLLDVGMIFSIQFVTDSDSNVVGVFTGDLWDSFNEAVKLARQIYMRPVDTECDVVVAINSDPLDRNLYQLQKAFENVRSITRDGGCIIVVSRCAEGIGNDEFFRLADKYPKPADILSTSPDGFNLGFHKLYRTALHTTKVRILVKSGLDNATVRKVYLEPIDDLQEVIDSEIERIGENTRVMFIKDAGIVVPYVDRAA